MTPGAHLVRQHRYRQCAQLSLSCEYHRWDTTPCKLRRLPRNPYLCRHHSFANKVHAFTPVDYVNILSPCTSPETLLHPKICTLGARIYNRRLHQKRCAPAPHPRHRRYLPPGPSNGSAARYSWHKSCVGTLAFDIPVALATLYRPPGLGNVSAARRS